MKEETQGRDTSKNTVNKDEKVYSKNQFNVCVCIIVIVNLVMICVWLFTANADSNFASHFSFASTVTSIILSVLAIFMSVTGESKTQTIRERIEQEADEITEVTEKLEKEISSISEKISIVVNNTDSIRSAVNLPDGVSGSIQISSTNSNVTKQG